MLTDKIDKDFFKRILTSRESSPETKRDILYVMIFCVGKQDAKGLNRAIADKLVLDGIIEILIDLLLIESDTVKNYAILLMHQLTEVVNTGALEQEFLNENF